MLNIEKYKSALKSKGLKATPQRLEVHRAMMDLGHASAETVKSWIVDNSSVSITTSSIYNILSNLSDIGIYSRRMSRTNKMFFDVTPGKHIHLYDTKTNTLKDIPDSENVIEMVENCFKKRRFKGFRIDGFDIQIICHSTKKQDKK